MKHFLMLALSLMLIGCGQKQKAAKIAAEQDLATNEVRNQERAQAEQLLGYHTIYALSDFRKEAYQLMIVERLREKLSNTKIAGEASLLALDLKKESDELTRLYNGSQQAMSAIGKNLKHKTADEQDVYISALERYRESILNAANKYAHTDYEEEDHAARDEYKRLDSLKESQIFSEFTD